MQLENVDDSNTIELPDSILEGVPEEEKDMVKHMLSMSMQVGGVISPQTELMRKITPDNIDHFFDVQEKESALDYRRSRDEKVYKLIGLLLVSALITIIIVLLRSNPNVLEKVLYAVGGLVAGALGGYGIGKSKSDR